MSRLVLSGAILSISLLMSGCQPPASGEAAGLSIHIYIGSYIRHL